MALFKEINCVECGNKTSVMTRRKLSDDQYLCASCVRKLPIYLMDDIEKRDLEWYHETVAYIENTNRELKEIFHETHNFHGIHLDMENKIFYVEEGLFEEPLFLDFKNLVDFKLFFNPGEFKDGMLESKVTGTLVMILEMNKPVFMRTKKISTNVKAPAKKKMFGTKIKHGNPKGMDEFLLYFSTAWETAMIEENEKTEFFAGNIESSELQQAMGLFMLDDLEGITLDDLKARRNRLIKSFHPDTNSEVDVLFAQKINKAFELLKKEL